MQTIQITCSNVKSVEINDCVVAIPQWEVRWIVSIKSKCRTHSFVVVLSFGSKRATLPQLLTRKLRWERSVSKRSRKSHAQSLGDPSSRWVLVLGCKFDLSLFGGGGNGKKSCEEIQQTGHDFQRAFWLEEFTWICCCRFQLPPSGRWFRIKLNISWTQSWLQCDDNFYKN